MNIGGSVNMVAFIASAASRETSPEIMDAIAFLARNVAEAEALWADGFSTCGTVADVQEIVTKNGRRDASEFVWGAAGTDGAQEPSQ
jgi:hypothetical protein